MRALRLLALFALLAMPAAGGAREEFRAVIQSQLDAFAADDLPQAFSYASPAIREIFRTPENFGQMVATGYPMIWRPRVFEFLDTWSSEGRQFQRVSVRGADGVTHQFDYEMIEIDGAWRINGVYPVAEAAPSV